MMIATRRLEELWERYETQVFEYCKEQFEEYVKPYCIKHDCEFIVTGDGTFYLSAPSISETELINSHHDLFAILYEEIPGMYSELYLKKSAYVGSKMPDYRRPSNEH